MLNFSDVQNSLGVMLEVSFLADLSGEVHFCYNDEVAPDKTLFCFQSLEDLNRIFYIIEKLEMSLYDFLSLRQAFKSS